MARLRSDDMPARVKLINGYYYYAPGALGRKANEQRKLIPLGRDKQKAANQAILIQSKLGGGFRWNGSAAVPPEKLRSLVYRSRSRAKQIKVEHDLTEAFVREMYSKQGGKCAVTGIEFCADIVGIRNAPWSPSIDRVDSRRGYTTDNVRLVCHAVNVALNEWGEDVLLTMASAIFGKPKPRIRKEIDRRIVERLASH